MELKFTQAVKDNWIEALESGEYKQGYGELETTEPEAPKRHCCIGVLGAVTKGLQNFPNNNSDAWNCPYEFLEKSGIVTKSIWEVNDLYDDSLILGNKRPEGYKDDYSNVIELIKGLPVIEETVEEEN